MLVCFPPPGGPFKTCSVDLCKIVNESPDGCTPIQPQLSCTYGNGGAVECEIDLTGTAEQTTPYIVTTTATMADGKRKSRSEARDSLSVPLFP